MPCHRDYSVFSPEQLELLRACSKDQSHLSAWQCNFQSDKLSENDRPEIWSFFCRYLESVLENQGRCRRSPQPSVSVFSIQAIPSAWARNSPSLRQRNRGRAVGAAGRPARELRPRFASSGNRRPRAANEGHGQHQRGSVSRHAGSPRARHGRRVLNDRAGVLDPRRSRRRQRGGGASEVGFLGRRPGPYVHRGAAKQSTCGSGTEKLGRHA